VDGLTSSKADASGTLPLQTSITRSKVSFTTSASGLISKKAWVLTAYTGTKLPFVLDASSSSLSVLSTGGEAKIRSTIIDTRMDLHNLLQAP